MRNIVDILQSKFIKRGVAIKNLEYGKVEPAAGGMVRQSIRVKQGIEADVAKKITKDIKNLNPLPCDGTVFLYNFYNFFLSLVELHGVHLH